MALKQSSATFLQHDIVNLLVSLRVFLLVPFILITASSSSAATSTNSAKPSPKTSCRSHFQGRDIFNSFDSLELKAFEALVQSYNKARQLSDIATEVAHANDIKRQVEKSYLDLSEALKRQGFPDVKEALKDLFLDHLRRTQNVQNFEPSMERNAVEIQAMQAQQKSEIASRTQRLQDIYVKYNVKDIPSALEKSMWEDSSGIHLEEQVFLLSIGDPVQTLDLLNKNGFQINTYQLTDAALAAHVPPHALTPLLFYSIKHGLNVNIKKILATGIDVNVTNEDGNTPLIGILKAEIWNTDILEIILDKKPNLQHTNKQNRNALMQAIFIRGGQSEITLKTLELLLQAGAQDNQLDSRGRSALHEAIAQDFLHVIDVFVKYRVGINTQNKKGQTPVLFAVDNFKLNMISRLLKANPDLSIADNEGQTVEYLTRRFKIVRPDLFELFENHAKKLNAEQALQTNEETRN